jgi:nitrogen-specific signal transduction histidine kinase
MRERRTTRIESTAERKDGGIFPACAYFAPVLEGEEIKGIGLSVVHGIVKDHGGAIEVDSELGRGSAFHIFLPLISALKEKPDRAKG